MNTDKWNRAKVMIAEERNRQVIEEGWTNEHDNQYTSCQLTDAAMCYYNLHQGALEFVNGIPRSWPWSSTWWKPKTHQRDLVRAGALLMAERGRIVRCIASDSLRGDMLSRVDGLSLKVHQALYDILPEVSALPAMPVDFYREKMPTSDRSAKLSNPFNWGSGTITIDLNSDKALRNTFKISLDHITNVSVSRSKQWHKDAEQEWNLLEWAGAMCGEAGELANVCKKIVRVQSGMQSIGAAGLKADDLPALYKKLAQECADTFLYLVLIAANGNVALADAIVDTFNTKSIEYNFPERL